MASIKGTVSNGLNPGVLLDGVIIRRVTGHNAAYIRNNKIGPGSILTIVRSGKVIPYVREVLVPSISGKPQMPPKGTFEWDPQHVNIKSSDLSVEQEIKALTYFFSSLDVRGLKYGTVAKLYHAGLQTVHDIVWATKKDLTGIEGLGDTMVRQILQNLLVVREGQPLHLLMNASGLFGQGLGTTLSLVVTNEYPDIMTDKWTKASLYDALIELPGFSTTRAQQFVDQFQPFKRWLKQLDVPYWAEDPEPQVEGPLSGQTVVFTGFRDKGLEEQIKQLGGHIGSSLNSTTTLLLTSATGKASGKQDRAKQMGIKVMDEQKFRAKYKVPL